MSALGPSFIARMPRPLRRAGFRGRTITVVLTEDVVGLVGEEAGDRAIALTEITGLRAGLFRSRMGRFPELRLFLRGAPPLLLEPAVGAPDAAADRRSYPLFVRSLAARLSGRGDGARIETGMGWGWTLFRSGLVSLPVTAMIVVAAWTWLIPLPDAERWMARGFSGVFALFLAFILGWFWREHAPRRAGTLGDLDRVLPRR